jgi:hypothetical protein
MDSNFPSSFTNFLMSKSEDILSQPSDSNQLINDLTYSNLNVHTIKKNHKEVKTSHQMKIVYLSLHG